MVPAQLNAIAFRILISYFILWAKNYVAELPFGAFQNLYRINSALSSTAFYYFQGFKRTFITKCPDSDKQFKHLWFYAGGRWLHGHLARNELPRAERVLVASLNEHGWLGFSSTSEQPRNQQQATQSVTVARKLEPTVHYRSRTSAAQVEAIPDRPGIQRTAPEAIVHEPPPRDPSPESWGLRVADKDIDRVIRDLFPTRGLRIEEPMADRSGTKRPSDEERVARLQKRAAKGDRGKGITDFSAGALQSRSTVPPASASQAPAPAGQASRATVVHALPSSLAVKRPRGSEERPSTRLDSHPSRVREDRLPPPPASRSHREEQRPRDSGAHRALCTKFAEGLTVEVAESSRHSDPVEALRDLTDHLIGVSAAARSYANRLADDIKSLEAEAKSARLAEKEAKSARDAAREAEKRADDRARTAEDKLKAAENSALVAKTARAGMEESLRRAQDELASVRAEHARYLEVALPAALADARAQEVEDFLGFEDFHSRLVAEYQEGMRDMKAGFRMANPSVVGVDWSFVPEKSDETAVEIIKEGEVSGAARAPDGVVVLDDPEPEAALVVPVEQPAIGMELPSAASEVPAEEPAADQDFTLPDVGSWSGLTRSARSWDLTPWSGNHISCLQGQMLGPVRAPPFGQYPIIGPDSVIREPQKLGVYKGRCWVLLEHLLSISTRSWDLTPWSGNHRSCLQGQILGPARTPPFGQYPVMRPNSVVQEPQELSARADHGDLFQWSTKGRNSTPEVVVAQHSSRGSMVPGEVLPGSTSIAPEEVLPGLTSMVAGEVLPGSSMVPREVLPGSTSIVSREVQPRSRGSSTRVNKHGCRGSSTRGSTGGEVVVAVKAQGSPSSAKMLMPKIPPVTTPNVVGLSGGGWPVAPPSITCKREAPRNDGDTGVVSAVDTQMHNSVGELMSEGRGRALARKNDHT
ncbi:hypothetical protein TIFTF001_015498 [Ficus carica]|uniref:Uncharacterized protein n=1 Tax=Ficus carica TaxID=3494 RepID=A0AA88ALM8_FICCA|nr:hypothetical protein TIFTF001_015498 [Ficus carica]